MEHLFGSDHYEMTYWDKHQHKPGLIGLFRCFMPPPTPLQGNWRIPVLIRCQSSDSCSPDVWLPQSTYPTKLYPSALIWIVREKKNGSLRTFFRLEFKYLKMMLQGVVLHIPTPASWRPTTSLFFFFFFLPHPMTHGNLVCWLGSEHWKHRALTTERPGIPHSHPGDHFSGMSETQWCLLCSWLWKWDLSFMNWHPQTQRGHRYKLLISQAWPRPAFPLSPSPYPTRLWLKPTCWYHSS